MAAVVVAALAPLAALVLGSWSLGPTVAAGVAAAARVMMINDDPLVQAVSAAVALGAGLLYFTLIARQHADFFPIGLALGLTLDQVVRAMGDTMDPTLAEGFLAAQTVLSLLTLLVALLAWATRGDAQAAEGEAEPPEPAAAFTEPEAGEPASEAAQREGTITLWGGLALGALLFLELALLALPNAAARWTHVSYALILPWMVAMTALPLLPAVRGVARGFIAMFDGLFRGWIWFLLIGLCLVAGTRLGGLLGAGSLALAQFFTVLALWWVVEPRPADARRRLPNFAGLGMVAGAAVFALFVAGNLFTFVYGATTVELVAAFRGLGWVLFLAAALLGCLPMILARVRIPWRGGSMGASLALTGFLAAAVLTAVVATQPVVAQSQQDVPQLRIGTYNIHSGYTALYQPGLEEIARLIDETSVDIVLLQEVDTGRLTSGGVDQAWWLARRLRMEVVYYPTNEAVYGLAVLSRVRILDDEGSLLTSKGEQTGVLRVQVCTVSETPCPPEAVIDLYNTWLGRPERDTAPQAMDQWVQLEEVLRWVRVNAVGVAQPWMVVGGTFNNTPESLLYDQMRVYDFVDPFDNPALPADQTTTWCPADCLARYDYVWVHNLTPQIAAVIPSGGSDHRMAVVEVGLRRPALQE
ncbi:MAG: endonuclease/exonuclease/phosphatase family protein [Anaerolineae bacterium]|nr:endonuclease/exonuclease/phosphatase family protein [Anaerolineae bacterium]